MKLARGGSCFRAYVLVAMLLCSSRGAGVVAAKPCREMGCKKVPSYGDAALNIRVACLQHKDPSHIYLPGAKCQHGHKLDAGGTVVLHKGGCLRQAKYGEVGQKPTHCSMHHSDNMEYRPSRTCKHKDCAKQPVFGDATTKKREFCAVHKKEEHVDVVNRRCKSCKKHANFGSGRTPDYCADHRRTGDVLISRRQCVRLGCPKQPCFDAVGSKNARYCAEHKPADAIDITNRRCLHPDGCTRHPAYGDPEEGRIMFCATHRMLHHTDLKNKRCLSPKCTSRAVMASDLLRSPRYCTLHSPEGFTNVKVGQRCGKDGCERPGRYAPPGDVKEGCLFCTRHKQASHVLKYSRRAAWLESRVWGSYVDKDAAVSGAVLWNDASKYRSLYEDAYLLLIAQSTRFSPPTTAPSTEVAGLTLQDGYEYNGPNSATLRNGLRYLLYVDPAGLAVKICSQTGGMCVWDREEGIKALAALMSDGLKGIPVGVPGEGDAKRAPRQQPLKSTH